MTTPPVDVQRSRCASQAQNPDVYRIPTQDADGFDSRDGDRIVGPYATVDQWSSRLGAISREERRGSCRRETHFDRSVLVVAFKVRMVRCFPNMHFSSFDVE